MTTIGSELADQLDRALKMLRDAIDQCPDDLWRAGEADELAPARWALHSVETLDYYMGDYSGKFRFGHRFGVDWEAPRATLPGRSDVLTYLEELASTVVTKLRAASDERLMAPPRYPWTGQTTVGQIVYAIRHTHHHIGQIDMILRQSGKGQIQPDWR